MSYVDARARARANKNDWNTKLRGRGHRLRWWKISDVRFYGQCKRCDGGIQCGAGRAWQSGLRGSCPRGR